MYLFPNRDVPRHGGSRSADPLGSAIWRAGDGGPGATYPMPRNMEAPMPSPPTNTLRVLVFGLAGYEHAVDASQVQRLVRPGPLGRVPEAPDFVEGVLRYRGRLVPVVDLRTRFDLPAAERTPDTCVVLVRVEGRTVGFRVDRAIQLLDLPVHAIETPPEVVGGVRSRYMQGIAYVDHRLLILLNLEEVLSLEERSALDALPEEVETAASKEISHVGVSA